MNLWGRSRRWYAAAAGVVTIAIVAGGVVAVNSGDEPGRATVRQIDDVPPELALVEPETSESPSSSPSATASPSASPAAASGTPRPEPSDDEPAPPSPTGKPSATPSSVQIDPGPATPALVSVSVSDASLPTATKMIVTVRFRADRGHFVEGSPGDGHPPWITDGCYRREREDVTYAGGWGTARYEWSYRRAGTYDIVATLKHAPCEGGNVTVIATSAPVRVRVTPGANVANGPWAPHLSMSATMQAPSSASQPVPPERVWYDTSTWDPDGWLWKSVVDFGDGSQPEVLGGFLEDCTDSYDYGNSRPFPDSTWPWGGHGGIYNGWHDLPGPGTYTITVTAYSSNCDGGDVQTVTRQAQVTVPG